MDIADGAHEGDTTIDKDGLKVFIETMAREMLSSTTIDFTEGRGFVMTGMQQSSCGTCSC